MQTCQEFLLRALSSFRIAAQYLQQQHECPTRPRKQSEPVFPLILQFEYRRHSRVQAFAATSEYIAGVHGTMSLLASIVLACSSFLILWLSSTYLQRSYFLNYTSTKHGCALPITLPSKDPFFGLDTFFATMKSIKNHCRMRTTQALIKRYGNTYQSFPFGRRIVMTTSPRNIQHVLSLEHEKFGVGPIRGPAVAMTGPGIISNDGKVWEHGRAMIRPSFTRSQVANREMFDVHVERFLALLPEPGKTVDLQPMFNRLVRMIYRNDIPRSC